MPDNQDTPLEERLNDALKHLMNDEKVVKRLRFTTALLKVGGTVSVRQAEMLAADMMPYLERQGVVIEDFDNDESLLADFQRRALAMAWESRDAVENFKVMKTALKHKKG